MALRTRSRVTPKYETKYRRSAATYEESLLCLRIYPGRGGQTSVTPGTYFRMLLVGSFEGAESERGLEWRCSDSLSRRELLGLGLHKRVSDHSPLLRTRMRYPDEVYEQVFDVAFQRVRDAGLFRGKVLGIDSTYLRADASMKSIVREDAGDDWGEVPAEAGG